MNFRLRRNPNLYEINARVFLGRISREHHRDLTISTIPDEHWQTLARRGFDLIWLMGVWRRSPGARRVALREPVLRRVYDDVLPGWEDSDVAASPYAIHEYVLDPTLGKPTELADVRKILNRHGLGLILDFVPNHLALDHPWTSSRPQRFVQGDEPRVGAHPDWYFSSDGRTYLAHGRDPYFPPWVDTAQVNFFSPDLRRALLHEVLRIAEVADGVRCDMAMLALNEVFGRVWEGHLGGVEVPAAEFWGELIAAVRRSAPGFLFIAEVYWGLEAELLRLGFDSVYDKSFYDTLRFGNVSDVRRHLLHSPIDGSRSVRFIENHDESRAVAAFGRERLPAAAAIQATVPGLRLFHDGQLEGRRIRLPVQLVREPEEPPDSRVSCMYEQLLQVCSAPAYHDGEWAFIEAEASEETESHRSLLIWSWSYGRELKLVVVNYTPRPAQGRLKLASTSWCGKDCLIRNEISGERGHHDSAELARNGLVVDLAPWETRLLEVLVDAPPG